MSATCSPVPFCAYQLGLLGAEIIKVEVPGTGDLARKLGADPALNAELMGASFLAQNGGKRSDHHQPQIGARQGGAATPRRDTSHVLVENFRPGVMNRLGLGYEQLREVQSVARLLRHLRIRPGRPDEGRAGVRSDRAGAVRRDEHHGRRTLCAACGSAIRSRTRWAGSPPRLRSSSALVRRAATREGCFIDVSMLDSTLASMGWVISNFLIAGQEPDSDGQRQLHRRALGLVQDRPPDCSILRPTSRSNSKRWRRPSGATTSIADQTLCRSRRRKTPSRRVDRSRSKRRWRPSPRPSGSRS